MKIVNYNISKYLDSAMRLTHITRKIGFVVEKAARQS